MKVIIVNSPLFRDRNELYDEDSLPPLGLGYIATHLQNNNVEVRIIDAVFERMPLNEIISIINRERPDFVAVNIFTTNYNLVRELICSISINTHIIVGGLSTKHLYYQICEWESENQIDVITGDGELITLDIVRNTVKDKPFFETDNRRAFKIDAFSNYIVNDISEVPLDRKFFKNEPVNHPLGFVEANIVTSRGCVYNCTFCAAARSLNKEYPIREKSEISIKNELKDFRESYPRVNSIRVLDDLFLKNKNSVQKAVSVFNPFSFQWRSMAHVMTFKDVDDRLMQDLKTSGCFELFIGIESGSPKILNNIKKTKDISAIIKNLSKVFRAGINVKGYFIYGFPEEEQEDMDATFRLAEELKKISLFYKTNFRTSVFQYRPYHGSQIYHELENQGKDLKVKAVLPNSSLSDLVGRFQFNFHSGNYSQVAYEIVQSYIYRTINLNNGELYGGLKSKVEAL